MAEGALSTGPGSPKGLEPPHVRTLYHCSYMREIPHSKYLSCFFCIYRFRFFFHRSPIPPAYTLYLSIRTNRLEDFLMAAGVGGGGSTGKFSLTI